MRPTRSGRFVATTDALADLETRLVWEAKPVTLAVPWADAAAAAATRGQRLPRTEELMTLLSGLPSSFAGMPLPGDVLWSSSSSPFAPVTRVRAVACDGPARFVVVVLERTDRAGWWGVRL